MESNLKSLVEGYCQLTGRPAFTITVDEYIKFHEVVLKSQGVVEPVVCPTKEQPLSKEEPLEAEGAKVESDKTFIGKEGVNTEEKPISSQNSAILRQEKEQVTPAKREAPRNVGNKNVALELLKSIQG